MSPSPIASDPNRRTIKKPPACDACKAKRVLCHSKPPPESCPRCLEKGIECKTTPSVRRPRRPNGVKAAEAAQKAASSCGSAVAESAYAASEVPFLLTPSPHELVRHRPELSRELMENLMDCFVHTSQDQHPFLPIDPLREALRVAAWNDLLLPPQFRLMFYCVLSLSALLSTHPDVIGLTDVPISVVPLFSMDCDADLANLGRRRKPFFESLRREAFRLAAETRVMEVVSRENAFSCLLLDFLEGDQKRLSRPYGVAHLTHSRALVENGLVLEENETRWAFYLFKEAINSMMTQTAMPFTPADHFLFWGTEPAPLERLIETFNDTSAHFPFSSLVDFSRSFVVHVTRVGRQFCDEIGGVHARRNPFPEGAVLSVMAALTQLHTLYELICARISKLSPQMKAAERFPFGFPPRDTYFSPSMFHVVVTQRLGVALSMGWTTIAYVLHREVQRRLQLYWQGDMQSATSTSRATWERIELIGRQTTETVRLAAHDVGKWLREHPWIPFGTFFTALRPELWVEVALAEAAASETVTLDCITTLKSLANGLKFRKFSWDDEGAHCALLAVEARLAILTRSGSSFTSGSSLAPAPDWPAAESAAVVPSDIHLHTWLASAMEDLDRWSEVPALF